MDFVSRALFVALLPLVGGANLHVDDSHHKPLLRNGGLHHVSGHGGQRASLLQRSRRQMPPLYIPKMGLANVTQPTPFPPPPPMLNAWGDYQPMDTYIGNSLITSFQEPLTSTPPPSQAQLDLAFGCPTLLGFPATLEIDAPNPCMDAVRGFTGNWSSDDYPNNQILNWNQQCQFSNVASLTPTVQYLLPNGDVFGYGQEVGGVEAHYTSLMDCLGRVRYTVEEKIYKQVGAADQDLCTACGSCSGKIYLQYFIYAYPKRTLIATTAWIPIFKESYDIVDTAANTIATVTRVGGWSSCKHSCDSGGQNVSRKWRIQFAESATGELAIPTNRWAVSMVMTMFAIRDTARQPTGFVGSTPCELVKTVMNVWAFVIFIIFLLIIPTLWYFCCMSKARNACLGIEVSFCPRRMNKPVTYE